MESNAMLLNLRVQKL